MSNTINNVEELSPYKLLLNFSTSRVLSCMFVAIIVHTLVIGGLSTSYIYRTWIDPSVALDDEVSQKSEPGGNDEPGDKTSADRKQSPQPIDGEPEEPVDENNDKPPVVERVTDTPDPDEIPTEPGGLGLPIEGLE